jgi:hypothetical protein
MRVRRMVIASFGAAIAAGAAGCQKPLFSPKDERSQFDRYDLSRSQYAPQYTEDEFGRREPNLRGRLEPKG